RRLAELDEREAIARWQRERSVPDRRGSACAHGEHRSTSPPARGHPGATRDWRRIGNGAPRVVSGADGAGRGLAVRAAGGGGGGGGGGGVPAPRPGALDRPASAFRPRRPPQTAHATHDLQDVFRDARRGNGAGRNEAQKLSFDALL